MVSVRWSRCSRVRRGRIVERPKPSITPLILVKVAAELALDSCKSRENCARRWLIDRDERALVRDSDAVSVATSSSPLSLIAYGVIGLDGSKKTLFWP